MLPRCTPETINEPTTNPCENTPALHRGHRCRPRPWHHVRRSRQPVKVPKIHITLCDETAPPPPVMPKWLETRPTKRSECPPPGNLCPWVSCRYHLQVDVVNHSGGGKRVILRSDPDTWTESTQTCALDMADQGANEWTAISAIYNRPPNKTKRDDLPKRNNRGEADRQRAYQGLEDMRQSEIMRELAEASGLDPDGRPAPGASSLPKNTAPKEGADFLRLEALVNRAIPRMRINAAPIKTIDPESVDLLSLLDEIRKKNGKPKKRRHVVTARLDACRPKITYAQEEEKPARQPIEWIDL